MLLFVEGYFVEVAKHQSVCLRQSGGLLQLLKELVSSLPRFANQIQVDLMTARPEVLYA